MKLVELDPRTLKPNPENYRGHPQEQIAEIATSLRDLGQFKNVVVRPDGTILAGHGVVQAAIAEGVPVVWGFIFEGTDAEARRLMVADNELSRGAEDDDRALAELLSSIATDFGDLAGTGWSDAEYEAVLAQLAAEDLGAAKAAQDDPGAGEVPEDPQTKLGDVWLCGEHRVVCGDCTEAGVWEAALAGGTVKTTLTDPPYAVGLDYASHDDTVEALKELVEGFFPLARAHSEVVALTPGVTRGWLYPEPDWVLCWFYGGGQRRSPWGFNCWQPILVYGKCPQLATGNGCHPDAVNLNIPANAGDIDHPCPKPLKVWEWLMERVSRPQATIADPFLGSGTTLIAAEQLGRICYGIELEPRYVDVALRRWAQMTGEVPVLEAVGTEFEVNVDALP